MVTSSELGWTVRSQAACRIVTGTLRTSTWAPGWPQAARNSAGTAGVRVDGGAGMVAFQVRAKTISAPARISSG
jgi:hypothetical protein